MTTVEIIFGALAVAGTIAFFLPIGQWRLVAFLMAAASTYWLYDIQDDKRIEESRKQYEERRQRIESTILGVRP